MVNDDLVNMVSLSDDEWKNVIAGLNEDEFIAYARNLIRVFDAGDLEVPAMVPEMIEHLRGLANTYERNLRDERIAIQNEAIARANFERTADEMLQNMEDDTKGN